MAGAAVWRWEPYVGRRSRTVLRPGVHLPRPPTLVSTDEIRCALDARARRVNARIVVARFLGLRFEVISAPSAKVYGAEVENTLRVSQAIGLNTPVTWLPQRPCVQSASLGPASPGL